MSIYRRKGGTIWQIGFYKPTGEHVQMSSKTKDKKAAQELHDKLKAEAWREHHLGIPTQQDKLEYTWQQASKRWLIEMAHKKSISTDKLHINWLNEQLKNTTLSDITKATVDNIKQAKQKIGVSNATVNRMLVVFRAILNRARLEWEWIEAVPSVRKLPETKKRIRWLTHEEAERLLKELPQHLNAMARFSLATGLREANVTQMEWTQINLESGCAWVYADQSKNKKAIAIPLSDDALEILKQQRGQHEKYVFPY